MIIEAKREKFEPRGFNECIRIYDKSDGLLLMESGEHHPEGSISVFFEGYHFYSHPSRKETVFIELTEELSKKIS